MEARNVHAGVRLLGKPGQMRPKQKRKRWWISSITPRKKKLLLCREWHVPYRCLTSDKDTREATQAIRIPINCSFLALFVSKNYSVIHFIWWTFNYLDELLTDVVLLKRFRWGDFENSVTKSIKSPVNKLNWQKIISGTVLYILEPPPIP